MLLASNMNKKYGKLILVIFLELINKTNNKEY
ncbi:MAG: hypothetical protein KatS3mg084_0394 [Candidatus Dojkabacteria bacterium]|nr:MAG: hypothetical protein KatS3mg084_0394 [Candidatus Dojkabacteria bacterium]